MNKRFPQPFQQLAQSTAVARASSLDLVFDSGELFAHFRMRPTSMGHEQDCRLNPSYHRADPGSHGCLARQRLLKPYSDSPVSLKVESRNAGQSGAPAPISQSLMALLECPVFCLLSSALSLSFLRFTDSGRRIPDQPRPRPLDSATFLPVAVIDRPIEIPKTRGVSRICNELSSHGRLASPSSR